MDKYTEIKNTEIKKLFSRLNGNLTVDAISPAGTLCSVVPSMGGFLLQEKKCITVSDILEALNSLPIKGFFYNESRIENPLSYSVSETRIRLSFCDKKTKIFLLVGRTGSGKSTIAKEMCKILDIKQVQSYTTRPKRISEEKHSDHIFITPEDVKYHENDFAAYTKIGEYEYFTTWSYLKSLGDCVYVVDPNGIDYFENALKEKNLDNQFSCQIIYLTMDFEKRMERLRLRGQSLEEIEKRILNEKSQFDRFEQRLKDSDIVCVNNDGSINDTLNAICDTLYL